MKSNCLIVVLTWLLAMPLFGQNINWTPELIKATAKAYFVDEDGRHMVSILSGKIYKSANTSDFKVIKHFRGKPGVALPSPEEIILHDSLTEEEKKEVLAKIQTYEKDLSSKIIIRTAPVLPVCQKNETNITGTALQTETEPELDQIYVNNGDLANINPLSLGKNTKIINYVTDKAHGASLAAWAIGVRCLPSRVRFFHSSGYFHSGKNALKNYDQNPHGEGVLSQDLAVYANRF